MTVPVLSIRDVSSLAVLSKSDGSATWQEAAQPSVITSVNGPSEVRIRDEILGEATLELKILPASGLAGTRERYMEGLVQSAIKPCLLLGLHPRSLIQITSQVVSQEEGKNDIARTIAPIINSIIMACVDAGISMECMLAAAFVESPEYGSHVACFSFPKQELIMLDSQGPFLRAQLPMAINAARQKCQNVYDIMKTKIEEKVSRDTRWKGER